MREFNRRHFEGRHFGEDRRREFYNKWTDMTDAERLEFINKKMEYLNPDNTHKGGFFGDREFTVESIDARCEEWMKMTPEEKARFVDERKEGFHKRFQYMHGCFGHHGFHHGFHHHDFHEDEATSEES